MGTVARAGCWTFTAFCAIIQPEQKADLIDGVIYMASPEGPEANDLFIWLVRVLADYVEFMEAGKIYGSRVVFRIGRKHGPEPDIAFLKKERCHLIRKGYIDGPPDLAIEIVSPESLERDYRKKRALYQKAKVPEYWIIDEQNQTVTLLRLDARGKYQEVRPQKGVLRSRVLKGFWLRPEWLWAETRPSKAKVLKQFCPKSTSVRRSGRGEVR